MKENLAWKKCDLQNLKPREWKEVFSSWKVLASSLGVNLQGCKEEKNPPGISRPQGRRSPETESLAIKFAFISPVAHAAIHDCDLMMDLGVVRVIR